MKEIIEQGTPQYVEEEYKVHTLKCGYCGCRFTCTSDDLYQSGGMDNTVCPCCGAYLSPYTWVDLGTETRIKRKLATYPDLKLKFK